MDLRTEKVLFSKNKRKVKEIYTEAFPKEERMPFAMMLAMSVLWNTEFFAFYDADVLCGLVYMATIGKQSFIMFFAVDGKLRSQGYGSAILDKISSMYPDNKIIVSIEPCNEECDNEEQRIRRKKFYLANGYNETGYFMKLGTVQEILIRNGEFSKRAFVLFFMLYSNFAIHLRVWSEKSR